MRTMIFDIETIPDTQTGAALYDLDPNLSTKDLGEAMMAQQAERTGSTFLSHHLQQIVAISIVLKTSDSVKVWSLGDENSTEAELIHRFFHGLEKYTPTLVSWNGGGFDLPVLHYRALYHGIPSPLYWDMGEQDSNFKWNNYISRFHQRHTDLMDVLAGYQMRANASLDRIATQLGYPGKMGMSGALVFDQYLAGNLGDIRDYCETDVLNTYLVYLRFEYIRGHISKMRYESDFAILRDVLADDERSHIQAFLAAMPKDIEVFEPNTTTKEAASA